MLAELRSDVRLAQTLATPGRPGASWSLAAAWWRSPGFRLLAIHRLTHWFERPRPRRWYRRAPFLAAKALVVTARHIALVATKSEITPETPFDGGVALADRGYIIAGARHIGSGTVIGERVTIGMDVRRELKPTIGHDVWISPHCVVYGDIRIGDGATLMPHAVLSRSVPAGAVVEGNPGRVVGNLPDHADLRRRLRESPTVTTAEIFARVT